jgi:hypothetical protein
MERELEEIVAESDGLRARSQYLVDRAREVRRTSADLARRVWLWRRGQAEAPQPSRDQAS